MARPISRRALLSPGGIGAALSAIASAAPAGTRTVFVIGDETAAAPEAAEIPQAGWGMALPWHLGPRLRVVNRARAGASSRSFLADGLLEGVMGRMSENDVLLIQFGHNDEKAHLATHRTDPWLEYRGCLKRCVDAARDAGAHPVLLTPVERRRFTTSGTAYASHGEYPQAVRALASRLSAPLVDVSAESLALWQRLGKEETTRFFLHTPDGRRDDAILQAAGAAAVARIVAVGLVAQGVIERADALRLDRLAPADTFRWSSAQPAIREPAAS